MAKTRDYLDYLDEKIEIAPANSQEEYQAAEAIAGVMDDHGLDPTIEEFEAHPFGKIVPHVLAILLLIAVIVCGVTEGAVHVVFLLVAIAIAGILIFAHFGTNIFERFGPATKSQNVVAVHRATGEKVVKGARPIVIVAHYDTPREGLLWRAPFASMQSPLMRIKTPCIMAVAFTLFVQVLVFLPPIVRTFFWIVGILAALPPLALAILVIMGNYGSCTYGSNDNKSSVAAMLSVMNKVRPAQDRVAGDETGRPSRRRATDEPVVPAAPRVREVVEEVKGTRHGKEVLSSLGILPPSCEIVYEEPKVRVVEEPVVVEEVDESIPDEELPPIEENAVDEPEEESAYQYDSYDEEDYEEDFDEEVSYDEEISYDEEAYDDEDAFADEEYINEEDDLDEDAEPTDDSQGLEEEAYIEEDEDEGEDEDEEAWSEDEDGYEDDYEDEEYEDDSFERASIGTWFSERLQGIKSFFASRRKSDQTLEDDWDDEEAYEDDDFSDEWIEDEESYEEESDDAEPVETDKDAHEDDDEGAHLEEEHPYDEWEDEEDELIVDELAQSPEEPVWEESDQDELLAWSEHDDMDQETQEDDEQPWQEDAEYDDEYDDAYDEFVDSDEVEDDPTDKGFDYLDLDDIDGEIVGYEEYEEIVYVEDEEEVYEDDVEIVYEGERPQEPVSHDDAVDVLEDEPHEDEPHEDEPYEDEPYELPEDEEDSFDEYEWQDIPEEDVLSANDEAEAYEDDEDPYAYADEASAVPSFAQKIRGALRKRRSRSGDDAFVADIEDEEETPRVDDEAPAEEAPSTDYDEGLNEEEYSDEAYDDEDDEWYEEEDYDEEGVYDDDAEDEYYEDDAAYEDDEAYEPPVDPNLLHFDREEDHDIVPRDTTGLDTYAEGYDVIAAIPREEEDREAPKPIDDPSWGTSTYQPPRPVMNIARRAALFDLPDPSAATVDPLDDSYGYDEDEAHPYDSDQTDNSRFWSDGGNVAPSGWKGGATMRADLRDANEPIVMDEQELQEAILEFGDEFLASHDIWFVATGASELDHAGIKAFMAEHKRDIRGSFLINLEAVGAGGLSVITKEGLRLPRNADRRLVRMLATIAQDLHIPLDTASFDWDETDAATAMRSRVRSVTIAGLDDNNLPMYSHTADDVPENVDPKQVDSVVRLVTELIRRS